MEKSSKMDQSSFLLKLSITVRRLLPIATQDFLTRTSLSSVLFLLTQIFSTVVHFCKDFKSYYSLVCFIVLFWFWILFWFSFPLLCASCIEDLLFTNLISHFNVNFTSGIFALYLQKAYKAVAFYKGCRMQSS